MEEFLLGLLAEACEDLFYYIIQQADETAVVASENLDVPYSVFITGNAQYYFQNSSMETNTKTAKFVIAPWQNGNETLNDTRQPFFYDDIIEWKISVDSASSNSFAVQVISDSEYAISLSGCSFSLQVAGETVNLSNSNISNFARFYTGYTPTYRAVNQYSTIPEFSTDWTQTIGKLSGISFTSSQAIHNAFPSSIYVAPPADGNINYLEFQQLLINYVEQEYPSETITIDDLPSWEELASEETESETSENCCGGCNCTTIYVNADGSLTLQNDISGDFDLSVNNEADLSLNVNAAAGAFGAGAIVVDPDAEINITAGAGAFGAGAFGAGAIVSPDVNVSGDLSVGDISGEANLQVSEVNFDISGGDINVDQSGSTVTNNYNTTNNYYYGTTEPVEPEQSFTVDYNEILSEDELESILTQETYYIIDFSDEILQVETISDELPETIPALPADVVQTSSELIGYANNVISELGFFPLYAPLSIFSIVCFMLRGCK